LLARDDFLDRWSGVKSRHGGQGLPPQDETCFLNEGSASQYTERGFRLSRR
jgi:hypothetical protein